MHPNPLASLQRQLSLERSVRTGLSALITGAVTGTALVAVGTSAAQAAPTPLTVQMSVRTGGFAPGLGPNGGSGDDERRTMSDDGRYVVFEASGPVLEGQAPLERHVVRRDRHLGTTVLISRNSAGVKGNANSYLPSVSADGQVVAFHSYASNLVAGDTNAQSDIFVHDVRTAKTTRVSVTSAGGQVSASGGTNIVGPPSISADGRFVGFTSQASGLAPGDSTQTHAYLHDRRTGTTEVVSRSTTGAVVNVMPSSTVSANATGTLVAFQTVSSAVVPGDTNSDPDVFLRDRTADTTSKIPGGEDGAGQHSLSADGRYVVFNSSSSDLVAGDTNGRYDVFVHDRTANTVKRVSVASNGAQADHHSTMPAISKDGRYISFVSAATNLVAGDTNGVNDVFRHDQVTGQTIRVSVAGNGAQNSLESRFAAISGDGQHVGFDSHGRTLTGVDSLGYGQVYVRDLADRWPALHARVVLPGSVYRNYDQRIAARDIRTGPALSITWTPAAGTKGGVVRRTAGVSANQLVLRAPNRFGRYVVTATYAGNVVGTRTITVRKALVRKPAARVKNGKKLTLRTTGLRRGATLQVIYQPRGKTKGKAVKRSAKVNARGVAKVSVAPRRGTYRVVVRGQGTVLRTSVVRIR